MPAQPRSDEFCRQILEAFEKANGSRTVSGICGKYIGQLLSIMARRLRIRIEGFSFEYGHATAWCITSREDVETLQAIIAASWWQDEARAA